MSPHRRLALAALLAVGATAASCFFGVDPDEPRFQCAEQKDCGPGYECRAQAAGGGLCYPEGECAAETCDGADNDCDGLKDEDFDLTSDPAHCGACGAACEDGAGCRNGGCREQRCDDGVDNDQDGLADCPDDDCPLGGGCGGGDGGLNCGRRVVDGGADAGEPDAGDPDAGEPDAGDPDGGQPDAGEPDAGVRERACVPREADCAGGEDEDGDGQVDCEDRDCDGQSCGPGQKVCASGACTG